MSNKFTCKVNIIKTHLGGQLNLHMFERGPVNLDYVKSFKTLNIRSISSFTYHSKLINCTKKKFSSKLFDEDP